MKCSRVKLETYIYRLHFISSLMYCILHKITVHVFTFTCLRRYIYTLIFIVVSIVILYRFITLLIYILNKGGKLLYEYCILTLLYRLCIITYNTSLFKILHLYIYNRFKVVK